MDDKGTIFVGPIGDFGYLEPDQKGLMMFHSLLDKVPDEHRTFLDVWEVDHWQDAI